MSQSTRWCFTLNNYTADDEIAIQSMDAAYLVYGREIGESGTPHLQGFATYGGKAKRLSAVRKLIPRAHWEPAKGTSQQASDYCKKDNDYFEKGNVPFPGKRTDLETACDMIKSGKRMYDVVNELPVTAVKYHRGLVYINFVLSPEYEHEDVRGIWIYGPPGVGKSRYAREHWPNLYFKSQNKWWDGYDGHESVLIDDFDKQGTCLSHLLKLWTDRYACTGETKGGTVYLRHKAFIVTSNYTIDELWADDPILVEALKRRFKRIHMDSVDNLRN